MNRKLQHTMTALSASAAMLGLMLLAGAPSRPVDPGYAAVAASASEDGDARAMADDGGSRRGAAGRHARRARSELALPYFSIAHGLRRATGS